jgi:sterol desaturase/sphingolipid hydroxylase (fatty acid hydroxylase superfamily)
MAGAKEWLRELLGPAYDTAYLLASGFLRLMEAGGMHVAFFGTAALCAWFYFRAVVRPSAAGDRGFWRWLLPREIYLHRSAIVEYQYYFLNSILLATKAFPAVALALAGLFAAADGVAALLTAALGPHAYQGSPSLGLRIGYTVAMALAVDFGKWLAHWLMHRVGFLWEFHKVHHSAEVLTPFTNGRSHPVDMILELALVTVVAAPVTGFFAWLHPEQVAELTFWNIGIISLVYFVTQHLRHTHVALGFGRHASRVFSSPAMHQVHHSIEPRHWDRNFAVMFSLWDTLAGTNYVPESGERFRIGLPDGEHRRFRSVLALYFAPFAAVARRVAGRFAG